ncbi:MAG TPA: tetratricopeptide repeat protein [Pyrinomonadaceae bacterium]|nr:tetratricopeptide repeat protein [Pyrinomonadaceae bacterium]
MKRCPTCQQTYADETLKFCRHDGATLVVDSSPFASAESQATRLKLPTPEGELAPTAIFPAGASSQRDLNTSASLTMPLAAARKRRFTKSKVIDSLAVLPFANASTETQMEYLSDGITESIINSLSQLPKLRVVPRSTVFRYKGDETDPQEIGRALGVRAVLTGRVLQMSELLVVKAELIEVEQESQLWGEQYRRRPGDIFAIQEEIAQEISEKLRLRLSGDERKRLAKRFTDNPDAYHFYLKGRYYTNKRTTDWIKKGIEQFQLAIAHDAKYALAHAGLADAYAFLASSTGEGAPAEWYPKAKEAALKALELDDALAEAHTSLGFFRLLYDWDFAAAGREFKRGVELNPANANAHDGQSFYFKAMGQHEKAIRACLHAQRVDPLSLFANVSLGWAYYFARQYDRAVEQDRKALEMDPQFAFAHWNLGVAYAQQNKLDEAIEAFRQAHTHSGGGVTFKAHLGYALALAGERDAAEQIIKELRALPQERYVSSYYFAMIHLGLGETDQAFACLERAYAERSGFLAFIKVEPMLDPLRSDPRFADLERRVGNRTTGDRSS